MKSASSILRHLSLFGLLSIVALISCSEKDNENNSQFAEINYGTSFGECIGYCKNELRLTSDSVIFISSGWADTVETQISREVPDYNCWDTITSKIEINSFFELPTTIGCPDCNDGGAEWIEIILSNGEKHKVTFEYQNEPDAVKDCINDLSILMSNSDFNHAEN
jgi:hypothetical protein